MVDFLLEDRLTLAQLAREEGVHLSTIWRWTLRGVRGVKLGCFSVGGRRFTTRQAHRRFAEACTAAATPDAPLARTNRQRDAAISKAERALKDLGI